MAAGDLVVNLKLNGADFAVEIKKANELLRLFGRGAREAGSQARASEGNVTSLMGKIRDIAIVGYSAVGAFQTLKSVMFDWQLSIIETNARIEKMTALLSGLSTETDLGAQFRAASKDMKTMFELAESAPFSMEEMTKSFVKFKAVNLDDPLRTLKGLVDAVAAFGGSEDELHRASVAIMQMGGKGVISLEELRQQLGEAVPSAINVMARELGMSYFELVDKISSGTLEAQKGINALTIGFEKDFGGSAKRMMSTWNGMVSQLKTKWVQFQLEIGGEDGFFKEAKNSLGQLISLLDTSEMKDFGRDFGAFLAESIVQLRDLLEWIVLNRSEIVAVTKSSVAFIAVWQGTKILNSLIGGFTKLWAIVKLGAPAFTYLSAFHPALRALSIAVTTVASGVAAIYAYTNAQKAADEAAVRAGRAQVEAAGELEKYNEELDKSAAQLTTMERMGDVLTNIKTTDVFLEWRIALEDFNNSPGWTAIKEKLDSMGQGISAAIAAATGETAETMSAWSWAIEKGTNAIATLPSRAKKVVNNWSYDSGKTPEENEQARAAANAAIDAETAARKEEIRASDQAARATVDLERVKRQLASTGKDGTSVIEAQTRAMREYSAEFKRAERDLTNYGKAIQDARNDSIPGYKEGAELEEYLATMRGFFEASGTVMAETAWGNQAVVDSQAAINREMANFDKQMKLFKEGTVEYDSAVAAFTIRMTQLGAEFSEAEKAQKAYITASKGVPDAIKAMDITLPQKRKDLIDAIGDNLNAHNATMVSEITDIHALLEKKYGLPAGLLDETKWAETRDNWGEHIRNPKSGAMSEYQFMPATLEELRKKYGYDLYDTLYGRAELAALHHRDNMRRIHSDDKDDLHGAYNAGAGAFNKAGGIPNFKETQGYVKIAQDFRRRKLEGVADLGGPDGKEAAKELAAMDKANQDKLKQEAEFTREMVALHGQRGDQIAQITIQYQNEIARVGESSTLTEEQKTEKIKALYANMYAEIGELQKQATAASNEYDRQTQEIRLGMLTADKDVRLRLEQQLEIDKQRVREQGGASEEQMRARIAAMTDRTNQEIIDAENKKWADLAVNIGNAMGNAFASLATGGESAGDTLRRLIESLRDMVIQLLIIKPLSEAIANSLKGFLPGGKTITASTGSGALLGSPKAYATGGVVGTGLPHGIYRSPTYFPLANAGLHKFANGTGLLAEAGRAEAILPLERIGADLGVKANVAPVNIVVNNNAPGVSAMAQQSSDGNTIEIIIEQIKASMASDISTGRGGLGTAMERTYGLNRTAGAF